MDARTRCLAEAVEMCSELARDELVDVVGKLDLSRPDVAVPLLKDAVAAIVEKYGSLAALAAAEYYEGMREDAIEGTYTATLAQPVDRGVIDAAVDYACRNLWRRGEDEQG